MVVFILAIIVVEPWKRRRLSQTFEKKIEEMNAENTAVIEGGMRDLARHFDEQGKLLSEVIANPPKSAGSHVESTTEVGPRIAGRIVKNAMDGEMATLFAASAVVAAAIGWIARGWLGL